ncbi:MAG: DUF4251 domain-containing protein [Prevotellaceae bacterium]|nr:DUF4251 domain-containing protein [Prevotellaceae bacterium]
MKKFIYFSMLLLVTSIFTSATTFADDPVKQNKISKKEQKTNAIKEMIDTRDYTFIARTALPMTMPSKQLTGEYYLKISKDTIEAYLPYYGRAYTAPINEEGGIKFTSTDFTYKAEESKKGWDINIETKDVSRHSYELSLFVSKSGMVSLQVNDSSRQSISFNGNIDMKE